LRLVFIFVWPHHHIRTPSPAHGVSQTSEAACRERDEMWQEKDMARSKRNQRNIYGKLSPSYS